MLLSRLWSREDKYSAMLDDTDEHEQVQDEYEEINYDIENQLENNSNGNE